MEDLALVQKFFFEKKVLITGHTGFKGSWLTYFLNHLGAKTCGYSLPAAQESHFTFLKLNCKNNFENILDAKALEKAFHEFQPEVVFHLAAQPLVRHSYENPVETYEVNVIGSLKVYLAALNTPSVQSVVSITTDKVYENKEQGQPYLESDRLGGYDPYSASKACMEIMSGSFINSFLKSSKKSLRTVRAGNIIGGGDWSSDRIIPDLVRTASNKKITQIRSPHSIRPWQHVLDPIYGYLLLAAKMSHPEKISPSYNLGPDPTDSYDVLQVCKEMQSVWSDVKWNIDEFGANRHEAKSLKLDSTLAQNELHWKPLLSFQESIRWTAEWYKEYYGSGKILTGLQIEQYLEKLASPKA